MTKTIDPKAIEIPLGGDQTVLDTTKPTPVDSPKVYEVPPPPPKPTAGHVRTLVEEQPLSSTTLTKGHVTTQTEGPPTIEATSATQPSTET